ncbi:MULTISPECIES: AAA family ATPase [unclassified Nocardioides]|uniref:AAA family ATPase n=1 Tax=unclassified Nocardioides TaxID=2615069 RepID=UPI0006F23BFE|nr:MULTISPECIES: AAA family ATPase [unclassified Nocardioides]KQY57094.1 hypothetical protein ASD30_12610 [Nocardioides sp. Root140]KRF11734.1 hypothetical protein ASH02_17255 [Nocardioides sp. Soil796]
MSESREVVAAVADLVADVRRPVLVGIDGPDGSGKTHFARALVDELAARGRPVARSSVDHFHHPREHRHALGRTPEAVWGRHFDYRAMHRELLDPWRAGAGSTYTPVWHDVDTDAYVEPQPASVPAQGILVVDGVFLQRPELVGRWDLAVYLDVPPEVTVARMSERDGTPADLAHPDQQRYLRAQEIYRETCDPVGLADVVIDNADWEKPALRGVGAAEVWRREGAEIVREVRLPADDLARAVAIDRLADDGS